MFSRVSNNVLFVCSWCCVPLENTITGEGLYTALMVILTCYTYFDTGHPFMMVISEDPRCSHLLPSARQWSYHYLF